MEDYLVVPGKNSLDFVDLFQGTLESSSNQEFITDPGTLELNTLRKVSSFEYRKLFNFDLTNLQKRNFIYLTKADQTRSYGQIQN